MNWLNLIEEKSTKPLVLPEDFTQKDLQDMYNVLSEKYHQSKEESWYIQKTEEFGKIVQVEMEKVVQQLMEKELSILNVE